MVAELSSIQSHIDDFRLLRAQQADNSGDRAEVKSAADAAFLLGRMVAAVAAARNAEQHAELDRAIRIVWGMLANHSKTTVSAQAGWAAEVHHQASFNLNAMERNSAIR
jgi:hypothetical protein